MLVDLTSAELVFTSSSLDEFLSHHTVLCVGDFVLLCHRSTLSQISERIKTLCRRIRFLRAIRSVEGRHMGVWTPGNRSVAPCGGGDLQVAPERQVLPGTGHIGVEQGQCYIVTQEAALVESPAAPDTA